MFYGGKIGNINKDKMYRITYPCHLGNEKYLLINDSTIPKRWRDHGIETCDDHVTLVF